VDPQTGEATPLSPGGAVAGAGPQMGAPMGYTQRTILGTDPLTFLLGGIAVDFILMLVFSLNLTIFLALLVLVFLVYWWRK
jgi:hypothetical protein